MAVFIFNLHSKINNIEFENRVLMNPRKCKRFSLRRQLKEFSNKQGKKRTLSYFQQKFGTIGSTERTAVSEWPFLCYFKFNQVQWRRS